MLFRRRTSQPQPQPRPEPVVPIRFLDEQPPRPRVRPQPQPQPVYYQQQYQARPRPEPATTPEPEPVREEPKPAPAAAVVAPAPKRKRREWPVGTLAFLAVVGTGFVMHRAGLGHPGVHYEDVVDKTFNVEGTARVVVETFNGPVEVVRGESGRVECAVTKRGEGTDEAAAIDAIRAVKVDMDQDGGTVRVRARREGGPGRSGAAVRLSVPEGSSVRLETDNGAVKVVGVGGPVEARSDNGQIEVVGAGESVAATTGNGRITCEETEALVNLETSNGAITFRGRLAPGQSALRTRNGAVTVALPASQPFRVDAQTRNGKVATDFDDLEVSGKKGKGRQLSGEVGDDPKATLKVRTDNGKIRVEQDGD